jgi:hypothetical protein
MAVLGSQEIWDGRQGSEDKDQVRFTRAFLVRTDSMYEGPKAILEELEQGRLAIALGQSYQEKEQWDDQVLVLRREVRPHPDDPLLWLAFIEYSTTAAFEQNADPTLRPAEVQWGSQSIQLAAQKDRNGTLVANKAGDPYDPPPEKPLNFRTLTMVKARDTYSPTATLAYENHVNEDVFLGFAAECVMCKSITSQSFVERGRLYYRVTYVFWIREDTWKLSLLEQGYRYIDSGNRLMARDRDGSPVTKPVLLTSTGGLLAVGGTPVFTDWYLFGTKPFAPLDLQLP